MDEEREDAAPEYATAKIAVWWDMHDCPIPEGYDATLVRLSLEDEFKKLGYSGSVSITAYDDLKQTSDHVLRALSSTGVSCLAACKGLHHLRKHLSSNEHTLEESSILSSLQLSKLNQEQLRKVQAASSLSGFDSDDTVPKKRQREKRKASSSRNSSSS